LLNIFPFFFVIYVWKIKFWILCLYLIGLANISNYRLIVDFFDSYFFSGIYNFARAKNPRIWTISVRA
jgi:hypothetical protein